MLLNSYTYNDLSEEKLRQLCRRPRMDFASVFGKVQPIVDDIEKRGDAAVADYNKKFDGVRPDPAAFDPSSQKVELDDEIRLAIDTAYENIYQFHRAELPIPLDVETMPGIRCRREARPIERVGLYVPGGTALLPSTALMLGIPAQLAGCPTIVLATPPRPDGTVAPELIYIAQKIGATKVLVAGGAQAVAAMGLGTETVPKVDKLFGPGNQYVTAAKMLLQNSEAQVSIDMPAGPSEVLVIADETANPDFVAIDLLSQAEHGEDSQVVLAATGGFDRERLEASLNQQLDDLPRGDIAREALKHGLDIVVNSIDEALEFSNYYAPEHLIVNCRDAESYTDHILHAGSVFIGPWTPESVGDYAAGTNHTLPTYGYARMYSGVSVDDFVKHITMQQLTPEGLDNVGDTVETLASLEKLDAHRRAVRIRRNHPDFKAAKPADSTTQETDS